MDLHALQTHEWVLWCLWALILGQRWAKFGILAELQKLFKPTLMTTMPNPHEPDHSIISPCIPTMDLHALQTHEWVLRCLWAVILAQRWAKFGDWWKKLQKLFKQTLMTTMPNPHEPDHSIISPCIPTMDLHGLQTHEWVLW